MKKLINLSTDHKSLARFDHQSTQLKTFLKKHQLDGFEIIQYLDWDKNIIPKKNIIGFHMPFWAIWLDFWQGNQKNLIEQFKTKKAIDAFYGVDNPESFVQLFASQIKDAQALGAEYVVFHVSHVELAHSYNFQFTYTDHEITAAFVDFINEVTKQIKSKEICILFENLWWPGLTMKDPHVLDRMMCHIHYENKGFLLDIGHLICTNPNLKNNTECVEYIHRSLDAIEPFIENIKAIHLNGALTGDYIKKSMNANHSLEYTDFMDEYIKVFDHIHQIDKHAPFLDPSINHIIERIDPKYLVYELIADTLKELDHLVDLQNQILFS